MTEIFGLTSKSCPVDQCPAPECYEPCEHRKQVFEAITARPQRKQGFLYDLIWSILTVQEEFIAELCRKPDIVETGISIGFPPTQCGYRKYRPGPVIECIVTTCYGCEEEPNTSGDESPIFPPGCNPCLKPGNSCTNPITTCRDSVSTCDQTINTCTNPASTCTENPPGTCSYVPVPGCEWCQLRELVPYMTSCSDETTCSDRASCPVPQWIDLSQSEYLPFYTEIVEWIRCSTGKYADGQALNDFLRIFGAKLTGIADGMYSILMPDDELLFSIIDIIKNTMPLPFGATARFYTETCETF